MLYPVARNCFVGLLSILDGGSSGVGLLWQEPISFTFLIWIIQSPTIAQGEHSETEKEFILPQTYK